MQKVKRVIGGETPLEGLMRLSAERSREVEGRSAGDWNADLMHKLEDRFKNLKNASVNMEIFRYEDETNPVVKINLIQDDMRIAFANYVVRRRGDVVEASIEIFQGRGDEAQMREFRQNNKEHWNIFIVNAVKDAAYESGFSRVLLRDITTTDDYRRAFVRTGKTVDEAQHHMRQLYTRTRKQCDFSGKEGDYYVRKFP